MKYCSSEGIKYHQIYFKDWLGDRPITKELLLEYREHILNSKFRAKDTKWNACRHYVIDNGPWGMVDAKANLAWVREKVGYPRRQNREISHTTERENEFLIEGGAPMQRHRISLALCLWNRYPKARANEILDTRMGDSKTKELPEHFLIERQMLFGRGAESDYLFCTSSGGHFDKRQATGMMVHIGKRILKRQLSIESLRPSKMIEFRRKASA